MLIAIDFDGTIVRHRYPKIGEEVPGAVDNIKKLLKDGHRLILWTVREGELLNEAVEWCKERGILFYAVNKDYPEEQQGDEFYSRKLKVDLFIDDRNLGGLPSWDSIYQMVSTGKAYQAPSYAVAATLEAEHREAIQRYRKSKKKGLFSKFFD